jgi:hypothetical protein
MALAWFFVPYKRSNPGSTPAARYCAMEDFTSQILADGGAWSECEGLGSYAVVKVRASSATLTSIAQTAGIDRFPNHVNLSDTLGDLTTNQRNAILNRLQTMGYTLAEINAALPANWQNVTLRQVLRFALTRRLKPRYDQATDTIVLDGTVQPTRPVEDADAAVQ